jgi:anti-sigma regulatory factor (Ser/Thr protein kinase)
MPAKAVSNDVSGDSIAGNLKLRIEVSAPAIDEAMSQFVRFLLKRNVPESVAYELQCVFYEAATNIRYHSQLSERETMNFEMELTDGRAKIIFTDCGKPFDPTADIAPSHFADRARKGEVRGYGLAMIAQLSNNLSYRRTPDGCNELIITKMWRTKS